MISILEEKQLRQFLAVGFCSLNEFGCLTVEAEYFGMLGR